MSVYYLPGCASRSGIPRERTSARALVCWAGERQTRQIQRRLSDMDGLEHLNVGRIENGCTETGLG